MSEEKKEEALTLGDLVSKYEALTTLENCDIQDPSFVYNFTMVMMKIKESVTSYEKARTSIIKSLKGEIDEQTGRFTLPSDEGTISEYTEKVGELDNKEIEIDLPSVKISKVKGLTKPRLMGDLLSLGVLVPEEEPKQS